MKKSLLFDMRRLLRWYVSFMLGTYLMAVLIGTVTEFQAFVYGIDALGGGGCLAFMVMWLVMAWSLDQRFRARLFSFTASVVSGGVAVAAFKSPSIGRVALVIISIAILACATGVLARETEHHPGPV